MPTTTTENYLVFHTAGQPLGLPAAAVAEIVPMVPLTDVPAMPPFLAGFLDWRNGETPLPVLRLERLLRLPRPANVPGLHTPIIAVRKASDAPPVFGLLVERVEGLMNGTIDSEDHMLARQSFNGCVVGLLTRPNNAEPAAVLAVERLLIAEEQERLDAFHQVLSKRKSELDAV